MRNIKTLSWNGAGFFRQEADDTSGNQTPHKTAEQGSDHKNASEGTGENVEDNKKPFPLFGSSLDAVGHEWMKRDSYYSRESYENLVSILNNDGEKPQAVKEEPVQVDSASESDM